MSDPWPDVEASGNWLLGIERDWNPDLIHLNSFGHGTLRWRAPMVVTAHSCVASWWSAVKHEPLPSEWMRYHSLVRECLHSAGRITVPTQWMRQALACHYGLDPAIHGIDVIPNGRNPSRFRVAPKQPFILTAGRLWDEAKNAKAMARAAAALPWPVYLAGDTGAASHATCIRLGRLTPDDMADWYARASIYALPARYEPFGYSPLEAALSGCALVLGDIPSLRETWGDAALFVSPDDERELVEVLRVLIADPEERAELARRACVRAAEFGPQQMLAGYMDAYRLSLKENYTCVS